MELIKHHIKSLWRQFQNFWSTVLFLIYRARLRRHLKPDSQLQAQYLDEQLRRTLPKKDNRLPNRAKSLIDKTSELVDLSLCEVLCVGCRNTAELDYFRGKGAKSVLGIDLYSPRHDILVMDMHSLTFKADRFDLVYSSHSLEHALNPEQVIKGLIRILKNKAIIVVEVPIQYDTTRTGADLIDFRSLENLHNHFKPYLEEILWSETRNVHNNEIGTDVVRTIIRINK